MVGEPHVMEVDGEPRLAALSAWAPGERPSPSRDTYLLLGETAARIHDAADTFSHPPTGPTTCASSSTSS